MQKRGQVTIYIIVGIVILAVFGIIFFLGSSVVKQDFQSELKNVKVPEQIKPVKGYLDSCIEDVVYNGAQILGSSGGYIDIPIDDLSRGIFNEFSNSLEIGSSEVAYWYYKSSNNLDKTQIPSIGDMEKELEEYVNENVGFCLRDLDSFEYEGFDVEYDDFNVASNIEIKDTHIEARIYAPTDIKKGDVGSYFDQHLVDVDVNLGKMYDSALEVFEKENDENFLEEKTIDMMVVYDEIPFSNTEFTCERLIWSKDEVEEDFRDIVSFNLGGIGLKDSNIVSGDNNYFEVDLDSDADVGFEYMPSWPFYMSVSPSNGNLLVGDSITQDNPEIAKYMNLFFCMNNYHFVYDVKYPALVSLSDEDDFVFQFVNMVVIDKNQPREFVGVVDFYDDEGLLGDGFCENRINEIEVVGLDASNYRGIYNADVSYSCMGSSCYVGTTNSDGVLIDDFPICLNGQVFIEKEGYYSSPATASTDVSGTRVGMLLEPYYDVDVKFRVVDLNTGQTRNLVPDEESAIFQFRNLDNDYTTMVVSGLDEVTLINGNYEVTTYLMDEGGSVTIEGQEVYECVDVPKGGVLGVLGFEEEKCFEYEYEDSEVDGIMTGGIVFEYEFTHNDLGGASEITLYAPFVKEADTYEDVFDIINNLESRNVENYRYPEVR